MLPQTYTKALLSVSPLTWITSAAHCPAAHSVMISTQSTSTSSIISSQFTVSAAVWFTGFLHLKFRFLGNYNNDIIHKKVILILLCVPKTTKWYPALTVWKGFWLRGFTCQEAKMVSFSIAHKRCIGFVCHFSLLCTSPDRTSAQQKQVCERRRVFLVSFFCVF